MDEATRDFVLEAHEGLERIEHELLLLEGDPANREILRRLFRSIHTIKGGAGFYIFPTWRVSSTPEKFF